MHTLRIEMNQGHGWQLRAEGKIPAEVTAEQIERNLQDYAIQYPHRAMLDGVEIARAGNLPTSTMARSAFDELMALRDDDRR
jgi:hypothetical protein